LQWDGPTGKAGVASNRHRKRRLGEKRDAKFVGR
jgi:hypothetical protein